MRSQNTNQMVDSGQTKIKICGLYRDADIDAVNQYQPDYAGFVFYPSSHRYVTWEQMKDFREKLRPEIPAVGVCVNLPVEEVAAHLKEGLIQIAQLHGTEDEAYMEMLRSLVPGCEIWKACKIRSAEDLQKIENSSADRILLDNGYGTGNCFDWRLLKDWSTKQSFLLAGGLQSENIKEAINNFAPWGVDISSGVETDKKKDPDKIRKIIEQVRSK